MNNQNNVFYVELNGSLYKIIYNLESKDEDINIKRIDGDNNYSSITKDFQEYKGVLNILAIKPLECNLLYILKRKIANNEFASIEEYNEYLARLNISDDEIAMLNEKLLPMLEKSLGTKVVLYPSVYEVIFEELQKQRNDKEELHCNFSVAFGDISFKMYERKDDTNYNFDFHEPTSWQFTETFKANFLKQIVVDFAERDHHNEDDLLIKNGDDTYTLNFKSRSNASLVITGITESYAKDLEKIIKNTKVIGDDSAIKVDEKERHEFDANNGEVINNPDYVEDPDALIHKEGQENEEEKAKQNENDTARKRVIPGYNGINSAGNIKIKFLLIFAAEAIMAIVLLTYLLIK